MPQLNPSPWFLIFIATWFIFIAISTLKISKQHLSNPPTPKHYKNINSHWTWPWP